MARIAWKTQKKRNSPSREAANKYLAEKSRRKALSKDRTHWGRRRERPRYASVSYYELPFDETKRPNLIDAFKECSDAGEALDVARSIIAKAFPEAASELLSILPKHAEELYADRDKKTYRDPVSFFRDKWEKYEGNMYLDDLNRLDPKLAPAIRSFCQRSGYKDLEGNPLLPKDILPPVRPDRGAPVTAVPGTVAHEVQRRKVAHRMREAHRRHKTDEPSP